MLDMGFIPDVKRLIKMLPGQRQTLLFSATVPPEVRTLSETLLNNPETISVARTSATAATVAQGVYLVDKRFKRQLLLHLLKNSAMERVIVFTGTKHLADRLERDLRKAGHRAEALHGNKSQNARERVLREFKSQRPPVLVATDIAARGLDVDGVSHVVNFDLPHVPETYVHRIGRTGRAGEEGIAVSFCGGDERAKLRAIERLIRQSIAVHQDQPKYQNESVNDLPASQSSDGSGSAESRELAPRPAYKPNGAPQGGAKPWKGQSAFGGMPGGGKKRFKGRGRRAGIKAARPKQGVGAN
jgi:ATP-dependent RNA helicase RhlE